MLVNVLALLSLLAMMLILRHFVEIFPSLLASLIRWKEIVNFENITTWARYRNWTAMILFLPFCIIVQEFGLYRPHFMADFNETFSLLTIIGIFLAYLLMRYAMLRLFKGKKMPAKTWQTANRSVYNFFILLTLLLLAEGSVATFFGANPLSIKKMLLWSSVAIYLIAMLRKVQILSANCHFLSAILYLCALEILPTGALVASAIIF